MRLNSSFLAGVGVTLLLGTENGRKLFNSASSKTDALILDVLEFGKETAKEVFPATVTVAETIVAGGNTKAEKIEKEIEKEVVISEDNE